MKNYQPDSAAQAQSRNGEIDDQWTEARRVFAILRERGIPVGGPWAGPPPEKKGDAPGKVAQSRAIFHATYPVISRGTVDELIRRELLSCSEHHWRFGDKNNGSTRRLDGGKWKRADNERDDWHKLIGLEDITRHNRQPVLFVIEGSKDALAAAELAGRFGSLEQAGIVCALGSGYRPDKQPHEIGQLKGRRVLLIGDNDAAGRDAVVIVSTALAEATVDYRVWDWTAWPGKAKDLYDALVEAPDRANEHFALFNNTFFSPPLSSHSSTIQPFNPSTNTTGATGLSDEEVLGIVHPFIVTERGTGNRQAFMLARAIKSRRLDETEIDRIHGVWFEESRSLLPPDDDRTKLLEKFYRQINRVRFTESGLEAAWDRAGAATPPFIPAWDGNEKVTLLAAFCRELQRNAGNRAFICPVNVVQRLFNLRFPPQADRLLKALEEEGVIKSVDRGAPHLSGKRGKPTLWRFLYPME